MADNFNLRAFLTENKLTKNAKLTNEEVREEEVAEIKQPESKLAQVIQQAWAETDLNKAKQLVADLIMSSRIKSKDTILNTLQSIGNKGRLDQYLANSLLKFEKLGLEEGVGDLPVVETKLSTRERYLTSLVENALGIVEEENPFGTNALTGEPLPDPASQTVAEDEMVSEKPLPKYENIEKLMQEIEHGTNEAAHKYKMDEMKRVYEALEAKVGSLEEGENAEHIDQKKLKQMRKDILALRKAEEKLRKEFAKKFSGKEKKETPAKEKAVEALQEGFDLRKFLAENKITAGSKILKEGVGISLEAKIEIANVIESWMPKDVRQTSDHMGEGIIQALEDEGIELPEGMFNNNMHSALLALSEEFHSGQLEIRAAVEKAVAIAMNPANYR